MDIAEGVQKENALREGGAPEEVITKWRDDTIKTMQEGGVPSNVIGEYFGQKEMNPTKLETFFKSNFQTAANAQAEMKVNPNADAYGPQPVKEADSLLEAISAGWQMSVGGLLVRGRTPDTILPEHTSSFYRIASQVSGLAGDFASLTPVIGSVAGGAAGAAAGTAVAGPAGTAVGTTLGSGAGAFGFPEAVRSTLMDSYKNGEVKSFEDFWERSSAIFLQTLKSGTVGAATFGVGGKVGSIVGDFAYPQIAKLGTVTAAEVSTMVTVGKALEGQIPEPSDFADAATLIMGMHLGLKVTGKSLETVSSKLMDIYTKTGNRPDQVAAMAMKDQSVQQDIISKNVEIPEAFGMKDPTRTEVAPPGALGEKSNVLSDEPSRLSLPKLDEKSGPSEPAPLSEADALIQSRIAPYVEEKPEKMTWDKFYTKAKDDLHPLSIFTDLLSGKKELPASKDPYLLARLTRGGAGRSDQFLELGTFDYKTLEKTGDSLKTVLEPVKENLDDFNRYAVATRALELEKRGIDAGLTDKGVSAEERAKAIQAATEVNAKGNKKYGNILNELTDYQNRTLAYLKDSGVISAKDYELATKANEFYVPFYRLMEEADTAKGPGKGSVPHDPLKEIRGSERKVMDPLVSVIKNTNLYVTLAERNRVIGAMVDLAKSKGSSLMEKEKTPQNAITVKSEELKALLESHGIKGAQDSLDIFRAAQVPLKDDQIVYFNKGKREVYTVDPDLAKAIKGTDSQSAGIVVEFLGKFASSLRAGATASPDFTMRNVFRDQIMAWVTSGKEGFIPFYDTATAIGSILKKDDVYQNWLKSGGANSTLVSMDRDYLENNIFRLSKESGLMDRVWNVVKSPLELLRVSAELGENATRLAVFKRALNGEKNADAIYRAGYISREATLDFKRQGGGTARAVNLITAFWNAHVEGIDRTVRAAAEDPTGFATKAFVSITLPSLLLWAENKDDPRWREIPRWQKDLFWIVMTKDTVYRIPKPAELGLIFGSMPERMMEQFFTDNPNAMKDFGDSFVQAFAPSFIPTAAIPVIDHFANKSTFTGAPIVPHNLEKLIPSERYNEYTTQTGKMIGALLGTMPVIKDTSFASPMVAENYIKGWTGGLGGYALKLIDAALVKAHVYPDPIKPQDTLADIPIVKAFVIRYPSANPQSITDFYEWNTKVSQKFNTLKYHVQTGEVDKASKEAQALQTENGVARLDTIKSTLAQQAQFARAIYRAPSLDSMEKRQQIDKVYYMMQQEAQLGLQMAREIDKSFKH